jgi:hypothetical protein
MTDPPALAFANAMHPTNGAAAFILRDGVSDGDVPANCLAAAIGVDAMGVAAPFTLTRCWRESCGLIAGFAFIPGVTIKNIQANFQLKGKVLCLKRQ